MTHATRRFITRWLPFFIGFAIGAILAMFLIAISRVLWLILC